MITSPVCGAEEDRPIEQRNMRPCPCPHHEEEDRQGGKWLPCAHCQSSRGCYYGTTWDSHRECELDHGHEGPHDWEVTP